MMRKYLVVLVLFGFISTLGASQIGPLDGGKDGDPMRPTALPWAVPPPWGNNQPIDISPDENIQISSFPVPSALPSRINLLRSPSEDNRVKQNR